ncbi:MAG: zf-HC2 domain-containing protein, partial [Bryobacteraceae bacterium]|nr:zf-HC2 domain-containing protein [Bryobacteraceae bacterium]
MNCVELERLLSEYAEGALDEARKAEVERHLA